MATVQFAWLIETEIDGTINYRGINHCGLPIWTEDVYEAVHFCRRVDAEKFANGDESDIRIVEHGFEEND